MAESKPITTFTDGIEYLKEHGKVENGKFRLEKTATRKFLEQAGAPVPVQEAYNNANTLLHQSLWHLGAEMIKDATAAKKKEGVSGDALKDVRVELTALGDTSVIRNTMYACKKNRAPQTNEIIEKFGAVRHVVDLRRTGVTEADVDALSASLKEIIGAK